MCKIGVHRAKNTRFRRYSALRLGWLYNFSHLVPTPIVGLTLSQETWGWTSIYKTTSVVTVNQFINGKCNDRLYTVKSSVYNQCPTVIQYHFECHWTSKWFKGYVILQSYTIFVIFRTFSTQIRPEPVSFMSTSQG